jgi:hypothetical protein
MLMSQLQVNRGENGGNNDGENGTGIEPTVHSIVMVCKYAAAVAAKPKTHTAVTQIDQCVLNLS